MRFFIGKHYQETISKNHASVGIATINESHGPIFSIVFPLTMSNSFAFQKRMGKTPKALLYTAIQVWLLPFVSS